MAACCSSLEKQSEIAPFLLKVLDMPRSPWHIGVVHVFFPSPFHLQVPGTSQKPGTALFSPPIGPTKKKTLLHAFCFVMHNDSANYREFFSPLVRTKKWVSDDCLRMEKAVSIY